MDMQRQILNALNDATRDESSPEIAMARASAVASFYGGIMDRKEASRRDNES